MAFDDLSDAEWASIAPLVSEESDTREERRGRPRIDLRNITNAILWILTTRQPWKCLPDHYPSIPTCRRRFAHWRSNGVLEEITHVLTRVGRDLSSTRTSPLPASAVPVSQYDEETPSLNNARRLIWKRNGSGDIADNVSGEPFDPSLNANGIERQISMLQCVMRCSTEYADTDGYVIRAGFDVLCNGTYRAWGEVIRNRQRIERSGLIGPRFSNADQAEQYALEWGRVWIARQRDRMAVVGSAASAVSGLSLDIRITNHNGPLDDTDTPYLSPCSRTLQISEV